MESCCLKCKKYTKNIDPQVFTTSNGKTMYHKNVHYVVVKNLDLLKSRSKRIIK